jgi:hypothetical protein
MTIDQIESILASEIECSIFETHVVPALEAARKAFAESELSDERIIDIAYECDLPAHLESKLVDFARLILSEGVAPNLERSAIAWMVKGNFTDFFTDLEEAHKYAMTVRAKVIPLYAWGD